MILSLLLLIGVDSAVGQRNVPGLGEVSSDYVSIEVIASHEAIPAGSKLQVGFQVRVDDGWFVHSNTPSYSLFSPVQLMLDNMPGVSVRSVRYPTGVSKSVSFAERPFDVYEGTFHVIAEFDVHEQLAARELNLQMMLNYQACDEEVCVSPAGEAFRVPVSVLAPGADPVPLYADRLHGIVQAMDGTNERVTFRPWVVLFLLLIAGWLVSNRIRKRDDQDGES